MDYSKNRLSQFLIAVVFISLAAFLVFNLQDSDHNSYDARDGKGKYCNSSQIYVETKYETGKTDSEGDSYTCVSKKWLHPRQEAS